MSAQPVEQQTIELRTKLETIEMFRERMKREGIPPTDYGYQCAESAILTWEFNQRRRQEERGQQFGSGKLTVGERNFVVHQYRKRPRLTRPE